MQRRILRAFAALCVISGAMVCGQARAALVTDSYQFNNTASDGSTVSGTFTYDTANPTVVTDLTMSIGGDSFDSASSALPPTLPTFDGSELVGPFDLNFGFIIFLVDDSGAFGPGATGTASEESYAFGEIPDGDPITVSGPITYDLTGGSPSGGGSGSSAPLPVGALGGLTGMLAIGAFTAKMRKRAVAV